MEEDTEYLKLPIEERCQHKLWKARINGYEAATKLFNEIDDEKSPEWSKYLGLIKKFVIDSNVVAQEKGLEAVLVYVQNAGCAGKTCGEVMSGIVSKCLGAPKAKTKEKALEIILMYVEIEKYEIVQEELIKGLGIKTPKIVSACIQALREALRNFGSKIITLKPIIKQIPVLLEDRDKGIREETKLLTIEVYRWIGAALKPQLASLKPVQLTELEAEFEKLGNHKAVPERYIRSQQDLQAKMQQKASNEEDEGNEEVDEGEVEEIDPFDLLEPVNILSKLPADFYEKCEAKKWQERKEAMETLQQLLTSPKLEPGDYGDLVRALKKIITKDSNVMVIANAGKCLAGLASGLKNKFHPYAGQCIPAILEKFKEKKQNVVQAMREAIDAIYPSTNLEAIQEDVLSALENKNPAVKMETAAFLARCFTHCTPTILNKKLLKGFCTALSKSINDTDPVVRDNSAEAIGTAMKVVGEKVINPFIQEIEALKLVKIKECCEKAVLNVKPAAKARTKSVKPAASKKGAITDDGEASAFAKTPSKHPVKSAGSKKPVSIRGGSKPSSAPVKGRKGLSTAPIVTHEVQEKELSSEEVEEKALEIIPADLINNLADPNWKSRLAAIEQLTETIKSMDRADIPTQAIVRILAKKPGFKDTNFQVLKQKLDLVTYLALNSNFTKRSAQFCVLDLADKLGDSKNGSAAAEALSAIAEVTKLEYVSLQILDIAFSQKNPKTQAEAMNWLSNALKEFGFQIQIKVVIDYIKRALAATNPAVRTSAISLLGVMYLFMGSSLRVCFENEKAALLQQIDAEFEKLQGVIPPKPIRGTVPEPESVDDDMDEDDISGDSGPSVNIADLIPRNDIGAQLTSNLLQEMSDKNWKVRGEALQKLATIISEAKFITPNLADLHTTLRARMTDSNKNLNIQALNICQAIGTAMGPNCTKYIRTLAPGMVASMGNNKNTVRSAASACMNAWVEQCGLNPFIEGEMLSEALKLENPCLRIELLGWMAEKLPSVRVVSPDLALCLPYLYACLEDRNADVRKKAQEAVLPIMIHLSYDKMLQAAGKLKPGSKAQVVACLDKAKPNLPVKQTSKPRTGGAGAKTAPLPSTNHAVPKEDLDTAGGRGGTTASKNRMNRATSKGRLQGSAKTAGGGGKKRDEDIDTSPPLQANNLKEQRMLDEQRLRVLKWNFTSPRDEFYEQLKDQMTAAGFNRTLQTYLFHNDFKFHLKAIDTFIECVDSAPDATVANVDLILKWFALRFFDTNPSVILKGLEYLQQLFDMLASQHYHMAEYEAASFIPYLILKIGDPKDAVRGSVKRLLKRMTNVYPSSKMFAYIMEGLKSKNARQRTECLDELGSLIEGYGINVCQPSAPAALKEVAKQISDRDNSVRNAALNCVVRAYFLEGDKVYKYVGPISDKDMSLLEERIKRSSRNQVPVPQTKSSPPDSRTVRAGSRQPQPLQAVDTQKRDAEEQQQQQQQQQQLQQQQQQQQQVTTRKGSLRPPSSRPVSGVFSLDLDKIEQMMEEKTETEMPKLVKHDIEDIFSEPVKLPETRMRPPSPATKLLNNSADVSSAMDLVISQVASNDINTAVLALAQIDEFIRDEVRADIMQSRVDQLLVATSLQLRMIYSKHMGDDATNKEDIVRLYRCLTMTLVAVFHNRTLGKKASRDVLKDLVSNLLTVLLDQRLSELEDGPHIIRSINVLVVRMLERSNCTNIMSALIKLLHDCVGSETCSAKFTDLIMKCIWKMVRNLATIIDDLNLDRILLDLHSFLKAYPSVRWKDRSSDTPLRTIKTVLHAFAKHKGNKIMSHLTLIDSLQDSEMESYLQKVLKGGVKPRASQESSSVELRTNSIKKESRSPRRLSKSTHEMLAEIFKKIGSKEYTREGLADLYDFKKRYPEANIEPFLRKSSQFFQNYIERGLKAIEHERDEKPSSDDSTVTLISVDEDGNRSLNTTRTLIAVDEDGNRSLNSTRTLIAVEHENRSLNSTYTASGTFIQQSFSSDNEPPLNGQDNDFNPTICLERLMLLRARAGLDNTEYETPCASPGRGSATPPEKISAAREARNEEMIGHGIPRSESSDGVSSLTKPIANVDDLRQRLERIKNSTKT